MSTELEQLAAERAQDVYDAGQVNVQTVTEELLNFAREVQRQTIEACAWSPYLKTAISAGCCGHCKQYMHTSADLLDAQHHDTNCPIRSLLSASQEVKHG